MDHQFLESLTNNTIPDSFVLNSAYEIENVLTLVQEINDKIDYFKGLKKYRTESIDIEINKLSQREELLRKVILNTMVKLEPKKNTLSFPAVGKVTRSKNKDNWQISNEEVLVSFLDSQGVKDQVVEIKEKINVTKVKEILSCFDEQNMKVPGVEKVEGKETIRITFEKDEPTPKTKPQQNKTQPKVKSEPQVLALSLDDL